MRFPSPSLNVVFDYFSHSCPKMCKICLKRIIDATFLDCFALTFCDVIGELLPEWACLTLQGGTTFLLTSKLADIPVSRVRIIESITTLWKGQGNPILVSMICKNGETTFGQGHDTFLGNRAHILSCALWP